MKKFILGFVTAAMIFGSVGTLAATSSKIDVVWNVKAIKFDGITKTSPTKPFVYNGATYVPLRFVAENLNKEVIWDKATQSVLINTPIPKGTYLGDTVKYMNYQEDYSLSSFLLVYNGKDSYGWGGQIAKNCEGTVYKNFLKMSIDSGSGVGSSSLIEFPLYSKYQKFSTEIGLTDEDKNSQSTVIVDIIVDDKILKTVDLKAGDFSENLTVSVKNGKKLSIRVTKGGTVSHNVGVILGNPLLN